MAVWPQTMKVVILAGGKGTRLGLTDRPKPMVPVAGKPLLEHLVDTARASGFRDFIFLNGHLGEVIEEYFGDGSRFGVNITHIQEPAPLGTGGAVRHARQLLGKPFIVIYGDILIDVDLAHFAGFHATRGGLGSLFVHPNDHPHDSDLVEADDNDRIMHFHSKPHAAGEILPNLVSGALYVLDPAAINHVPENGASDWGKDIFPAIVKAGGHLNAYRSIEYAKDVGTPQRLAKGEADLASGRVARQSRRRPRPAVFFDRDGVLNEEINGVHRPEDLLLKKGVGDAVKLVNGRGIPAICITNQPDIAKGFMTFGDLRQVSAALDMKLAEAGAFLDDTFFCPHHPETGWPGEIKSLKISCECRKPRAGMLLTAANRYNLDLCQSWLVGDRTTDMQAARAAGVRTVLLKGSHSGDAEADYVTDDFRDAVSHILEAMQ
jgi:histidinol-phosphate phosphatase family protein